MLKAFVLALIDSYRMSAGIRRWFFPPLCRFYPSCSAYAHEAITRHGIIHGLRLAALRVARCHPWNIGGPDPVPPLYPPSSTFINQEIPL